jgi:hypothetical protein
MVGEFEDDYDGIRLGSRPGDYEGETSFSADASRDYEDEAEEAYEFGNKRADRGRSLRKVDAGKGIGKFIIPNGHYDKRFDRAHIDYCDHRQAVTSNRGDLKFDIRSHKAFDGTIFDEISEPLLPWLGDSRRHNGLINSSNEKYESYSHFRNNVETLRNALMSMKFPDGEFNENDPNDQQAVVHVNQMARKLANQLKWESRMQWWANTLTLNFAANRDGSKRFGRFGEEHLGTRHMYDYLYKVQEKPSMNPFSWLRGKATQYDWSLPHPEESPFSDLDMSEAFDNDQRNVELVVDHAGPQLGEIAMETEVIAAKLKNPGAFQSVSQMSQPQREESVELGREILRQLRNICAGRSDRKREGQDHTDLDLERANLIRAFAVEYQELYLDMLDEDPTLANDSTFERARLAIGKLGHLTMLNARMSATLEESPELEHAYANLPAEYKDIGNDTETALIRDIEVAWQEIARRSHVARNVSPEVKSFAKQATANLHQTMTNPTIGAASVNIIDKAREVRVLNDQRRAGGLASLGESRSDSLENSGQSSYR